MRNHQSPQRLILRGSHVARVFDPVENLLGYWIVHTEESVLDILATIALMRVQLVSIRAQCTPLALPLKPEGAHLRTIPLIVRSRPRQLLENRILFLLIRQR